MRARVSGTANVLIASFSMKLLFEPVGRYDSLQRYNKFKDLEDTGVHWSYTGVQNWKYVLQDRVKRI